MLRLPVQFGSNGQQHSQDADAGHWGECLIVVEPLRHAEAFDDASHFVSAITLDTEHAAERDCLASRRKVLGVDGLAEGAVLLVLTALAVQPLASLSPIWASQGIRDTVRAFARLQHDVVVKRKSIVEFGSGEQG